MSGTSIASLLGLVFILLRFIVTCGSLEYGSPGPINLDTLLLIVGVLLEGVALLLGLRRLAGRSHG